MNVTVPVGVPEPGASVVTVAHTVTNCPHTDGFGVAVTVVLVAAALTVTVTVPVEPEKHGAPLYVAVTVPEDSDVVVKHA
ncbi:hypothetical protein [Streptomyces sp. NPDC058155]|uniref:hypothetical protein n=1 Tax=Streptomyces sp. NPDC058155 TaxID=3346359 RepID=UPI0036E7DC94